MKNKFFNWFDNFSGHITRIVGSPIAFFVVLLIVILWALSGPFFDYSDTWQLIINTGTTIITFLMVFIIQQSQNKDSVAVHLKLNELISANENSSDYLISIEDLTEEELEVIKKYYEKMAALSKKKADVKKRYSEEEAIKRTNDKFKGG